MQFTNWRQYQDATASFFRQLGCMAEIEAPVQGVRALHKVDVWVTFNQHGLETRWAIECKYWKTRVKKQHVLTLKALIDDIGADRGIVFSEKGFQRGAIDAARGTNITLITSLEDFKRTVKIETTSFALVSQANEVSNLAHIYEFPASFRPHTLVFAEGILFVGVWDKNSIVLVDTLNKRVTDVIELDKYEFRSNKADKNTKEIRSYPPGSMIVVDGKLFVGQVFSDFILVIDIETRAIVKRIFIPGGGEGEMTFSPDKTKVYFASNLASQFFIIDSATYEFQSVSYPIGGRGIGSILAGSDNELLYLGIQRGGRLRNKSYLGGNCFLAVYDLHQKSYRANIYLAETEGQYSDDVIPVCLTIDSDDQLLYVGMFQSPKGIYYIDVKAFQIIGNIVFQPNGKSPYFEWVDPLAQALYGEYLLSINRNNYELVIIERKTRTLVQIVPLGEAPNGPNDIVIVNDEAIISYPERNALIFVNLSQALSHISKGS